MTFALMAILAFLACPIVVGFWVVLCVGAAMRESCDPKRRADLATTPIDSHQYLRERLGRRLAVSVTPAAIGLTGLITGYFFAAMVQIAGSDNHYDLPSWAIASMTFCLFQPVLLGTAGALSGLFSAATMACRANLELSMPNAWIRVSTRALATTLVSFAVTMFSVWLVEWLVGPFSVNGSRMSGIHTTLTLLLAAAAINAFATWHVRKRWRELVAVYLILDRE